MKRALLIGNSFALLVAALELAKKDFEITILSDSKPLGGHFSGIEIQGHKFNFGMVMFENLDSLNDEKDYSTYNPRTRNDCSRFGASVSKWIGENVQIKRASTPECLIDGVVYPDYLIADKLDAFKDRGYIFSGANLSVPSEIHPSLKAQSNVYESLSYDEITNLCHGDRFHKYYIEPFVKKLLMVSSKDFLARYHRSAWAPLFYPETINDVVNGVEVDLPEYKFWTTQDGFAGKLVDNVLNKLRDSKNITFIEDSVEYLRRRGCEWELSVAGSIYKSSNVILGVSSERAHNLLGIDKPSNGDATSVAVLFALVRYSDVKNKHGCLLVVDESYASYRFTDQDAISNNAVDWHRVTLEANPKYIMEKYHTEDIEEFMVNELKTLLGVADHNSINVLKVIVAKNSLTYPSKKSVKAINESSDCLIKNAPDVLLTSGLLGYGVSSLNDQIVQGLKISQELK